LLFLARTTGGAIALPSNRASAKASVFVSSGAGLPTDFVGKWHKSHPGIASDDGGTGHRATV